MGRASIAANLVTSGRLEASDGASIHRCHKHVLSLLPEMLAGPMSSSPFEDVCIFYHDSPQLVLSSMPPFAGMARVEAKLASAKSEAEKGASSEMSPLIAAHVFPWAWRYNLGIKSAGVFARDSAGIL